MTSRLKNLYKYLIENRKHELKGWHDAYSDFYGQVEQIRKRIKDEGLSQNDEPFLRQLLYEQNNGISSRGQSVLSNENFHSFIENKGFISALEQFILSPNNESYEKFKKAWDDQGKTKNPLLVNRVAAACTTEVSTTVDSGKFNQVFSWLISEGIIETYPAEENQNWFSKNRFLLNIIKKEFSDELKKKETDDFYLSQFVWVLYENIFNPFSLKKQIVKYGAPGTGKTYQARQQASLLFDIWKVELAPNSNFTPNSQIELVQFHPSFSYEDFIEGLRPVLDANGTTQLKLQNGVFKEFCKKAGKWEVDVYELDLKKNWEDVTIEDLLPHREKLSSEYWQHIFEIEDSSKLVSKAVPPFLFIIDEVNRADLSRVFGELMYCLEYRGVEGRIKSQYANLNDDKTCMLKKGKGYFFIPNNVYIIGTMNTIDRSVESFDFALRRRFRWEEVTSDTGLLRYHLNQYNKKWAPLADNLEKLNNQIAKEPLLGHDYKIGHAYLMNLKYDYSLNLTEIREQVWDDFILPLLQEYLRGTGKVVELIGTAEQAGHFRKEFGL